MKFMKYFIAFLVIAAAAGYGIYYTGTNMASEKLVSEASAELESSGQMEEIKSYVQEDARLAGYMEEAKTADESKLPFTSKGEATRVLIKKVGISELKSLESEMRNGTLNEEKILQKLETQLTEEELLALKVLAYKELYGQ